MNDHHEPDPIERLRAADPAADVEPRAGFADDVVARATAEPAAPSASVADLGAAREKRRPRWIPIVAAAASLAVVGAVGYGVGASTGGSTTVAGGAAPPISLQTEGSATDRSATEGGAVPGGGFAGAAQGDRKVSGGTTADMIFPGGFGRNEFSASGLGTAEGTARAYTYDARAASDADTVTVLAAALGVEGTPELRDGAWMVGPQDGTAPTLSVGLDGTLGFSYSNPRINPWQCSTEAGVVEPCEPTGVLPSEDAAIEAMRSLLTSVGRDPGAFEFTTETWEGSVTRVAQAWPVVDGQRLDQSWSLELSDQGVFSAYGALADLVTLGEYAIVSEQQAFERLSDPRFGAQLTNLPIAMRETPGDAPQEWVPPTEPPVTPEAGTPLAWPVNQVEIVDARLGVASHWQPDGSVLVVPAYEFTDAGGGTWSVIAVADSMLDFATE
jgi:hypothetical protein